MKSHFGTLRIKTPPTSWPRHVEDSLVWVDLPLRILSQKPPFMGSLQGIDIATKSLECSSYRTSNAQSYFHTF
jgi:hypothetical protein